jgi:hypothetical protein
MLIYFYFAGLSFYSEQQLKDYHPLFYQKKSRFNLELDTKIQTKKEGITSKRKRIDEFLSSMRHID